MPTPPPFCKTGDVSTLKGVLNNFRDKGGNSGSTDIRDIGLDNINCLVLGIIKLALDLAGVVAFIMILYSVFLFATSYGEEGKIESAKKTLYWSIAGLAVIAVAWFAANLVNNTLK